MNNSAARRDARRAEKLPRDTRRPAAICKQGSLHPFKHASALYTAIIETRARLQDNLFELQQSLAAFPPYVSRGHGWKGRIKNRTIEGRWNQDRSKYVPHQGNKERAKRVFYSLSPEQRAVALELGTKLFNEQDLLVTPEMDVGRPVKPHRSSQESFQ